MPALRLAGDRALGLKYAFIYQPIEVPQLRQQFAPYLGTGERVPDLRCRTGATEIAASARRIGRWLSWVLLLVFAVLPLPLHRRAA